jgi:hypothetical protein
MSKIITPKSLRNQKAREQRPPTVAETKEWIVVGALAAGKKVYAELAAEHKKVFEMQEAAFMAVIEGLHKRIAVLEEGAGIASPDMDSIRAQLEQAFTDFRNKAVEEAPPPAPTSQTPALVGP